MTLNAIRLSPKKTVEKAKKHKIIFIFSNPCFEIWFLNHFVKTTRQFQNNDLLINELKKYIPEYSKKYDCFKYLQDKTETAIQNSKAQFDDEGTGIPKMPGTKVYEIIELLISRK